MRTNASQTRDRTTRPPSFHRRFDQIVVQKKEEEEEEEETPTKTRKRRISESADAMRKRRTKANNEEKTKRAQKTYFVARKNAGMSNVFLYHHDRVENASEEEEEEEEEESNSSSSWEKSSTEGDEDTEEEENFTRVREKKRKHRFRWECVRLSWKSLVDEYYVSEKEEEKEEKDAMPGRVFIAIPGRAWMMNSNEEDPEDENDDDEDLRSEYSGEEEEEEEDENAKALRRTREDCAKFSKEVINRIVFGVAWKKVHENCLGTTTTNNTITWSKYNRDPLDTMNTDEYEEDVYERELHAKARFDRRWVLEERVNWLNSFRKIVRKFREESFGIVGGKSRGGEEEEGGGEGDGGEKKKKKEKSDASLGLQKALVEDAVFRDAAMQATRKWPLPVEGEEKAFPMYDEWAEKEDPKKKKKKKKKQKKNKKEEAENDGRGKARKIDDEDVVIIEEEDDDKETKDLVRLVQNIKRKFGSPTKRAPGPSKRQHERPTERASAVIAQDLSTLAINLENYKRALIILIKCVNEESASWESAEQELIARRALRRQMQYSYPTNPRKDELKRELVEIRKKRLENLRLQSRNEFDSERYMAELLTEEKEKEWKRQELQEKAMATPQHSTYNTEPITWFPGVQNIGKQDGSKSNDKKQTTTTTKKKKKKKPKEPKISTKKAKRVQKKEKKKKETEEEEVVTGKIELEHLAPGMSIEIDSGDPEDPWWGEIVRLKKSDASIESKDEDEVEITWIVKNSKGKYEYLKEKGGRGRQNDVINVYSIKECGFHLPCAQASHKKRQNIAAKRNKPPKK